MNPMLADPVEQYSLLSDLLSFDDDEFVPTSEIEYLELPPARIKIEVGVPSSLIIIKHG